ncbi:MAG TPA: hypothetical protein VFP33_06110 [Gallionella sp.]|nr:hypothetical protein [Gallionella sp.]
MNEELKPCPWCGEKPNTELDSAFRLTDGMKYGALQCCVVGPEVRTDYKPVSHWKASAIKAWNDRTPTVTNASAAAAPGASIGDDRKFFRLLLDFQAARFGDVQTTRERLIANIDTHLRAQVAATGTGRGELAELEAAYCAAIVARDATIADLRAQLVLAGQCGARQEPVGYLDPVSGTFYPTKASVDKYSDQRVRVRPLVYAVQVITQPEHETIVREGDKLVCTACGTSAGAQQGDVRAAVLEEAAKLVIKFTAVPRDVLGPATVHMKTLAAVGEKIADAIRALAAAPSQAQRGTPKQHAALQELADIAQANDMGYGAPAQAQDGGPTCTKFEPEGAQAATHAKGGDE